MTVKQTDPEQCSLKVRVNGTEEISGKLKKISALIDQTNALIKELGQCELNVSVRQLDQD